MIYCQCVSKPEYHAHKAVNGRYGHIYSCGHLALVAIPFCEVHHTNSWCSLIIILVLAHLYVALLHQLIFYLIYTALCIILEVCFSFINGCFQAANGQSSGQLVTVWLIFPTLPCLIKADAASSFFTSPVLT
jgi:hypothetical protein